MAAGGRRRRATTVPYRFMTLDAIAALPVGEHAAADAVLFLWATRRVFREGDAARIARAWGFEPAGELIWGLRNPGLGGFLGSGHEPILVATRGRSVLAKGWRPASVHFWRQVYAVGNGGKVHSAKPDGFGDLVEQIAPAPYLELFARRQRLGWDTWGDEARCDVELAADLIGPERQRGSFLSTPTTHATTVVHADDCPALCDLSASETPATSPATPNAIAGGPGDDGE
jgi:N6-adenosine-specific RNA methylase IME4